jgi:hypothetical protein
METNTTEIFICECHSLEHQAKFFYDDEDNLIYVYVHLARHGFWKRLVAGIKYIFGYSSRFGEWDQFIFKEEDEGKLREFLNQIKREKDGDSIP